MLFSLPFIAIVALVNAQALTNTTSPPCASICLNVLENGAIRNVTTGNVLNLCLVPASVDQYKQCVTKLCTSAAQRDAALALEQALCGVAVASANTSSVQSTVLSSSTST